MKTRNPWLRMVAALAWTVSMATSLMARQETGGTPLSPPRFEGENVLFNWASGGDLQVAPTPNGPWTPVRAPQDRISSARVPALREGNRFFRIVDRGVPGEPQPIVGGDPRSPFRIARSFLRKGESPAGNAFLEVELVAGQGAPAEFHLLLDGDVVHLRDDGQAGDRVAADGIHTGAIFLEPTEFSEANVFVEELVKDFRVFGNFAGRAAVDAGRPGLFDVAAFERGELIAVHPSPVAPVVPGTPAGPAPGGSKPILEANPVPLPIGVTNTIPPTNPTNIVDLIDRAIFWPKSLMVTDLSVVEDPMRTFDPCTGRGTRLGPWTFGRLMIDMCNGPVTGIDPGDFTRRWLRSWQTDQVIQFDTVTNRNPEILSQVIRDWEIASGGADKPLDLAIAPFRLLAIVNRVDLRGNPGYGGGVSDDACDPSCVGGEARFVFGLIADAFKRGTNNGTGGGYPGSPGDPVPPGECDPAQFTVIFEYCVPKRSCAEIKDWGMQWFALSRIPFGPAYNDAMQKITDQFATAGADPSRRPNLSALSQLRVNELLEEPWDMREWRLFATDSDAGWLRQVTAKQTPDFDHNATPIIAEYCAMNAADILAEQHVVPLNWRTPGKPHVPFIGGNAPMPTDRFFWDGPAPVGSTIPGEVRHRFSLNTCNGCHAGETGTPFTHVFPRRTGEMARLSDFLTGANMPKLDPADGVTPRFFADLKRREDDLLRLIIEPCFFQLFHEPVRFQH